MSDQEKIEAEQAHGKSELGQVKQDIENANKQKQLISKAIANKVYTTFELPSYFQCAITLLDTSGASTWH